MALFSGFSDFLKKSVGNNMENKPEDVRTAKRNLSGLRLMDEDDAAENDRRMETEGKAKQFRVFGSRLQKVKGFIEIDNGKLKSSNFEWEDINQ